MQRKTIEKVIRKKLNEWLESITDKELSKQVKENLLLSGGSICNLFMGQEVNDYDIYLKDMDVLVKLVEYYKSICNANIIIMDGRKKDDYTRLCSNLDYTELNKSIGLDLSEEKMEKSHAQYDVAVRNLKPTQVKLYIPHGTGGLDVKDESEDWYSRMGIDEPKYYPLFISPNAISLSDDIQIVTRFTGDAEAIHKTFDFIHATNYFTFKDGLVTNLRAMESIITKTLYYQGSFYPLTSIIRVKKFIGRQWKISAGEMLKIMFQLSQLNLNDPDVLEDQLIGVDVAYFGILINVLRGYYEKGESITSERLSTIIDRIFNDMDETDNDYE